MNTPRDTAVAIATRLLQKLFERTWLPWSPTIDRAVARMVDAAIDAAAERAVERLQAQLDQLRADPFEQELDDLSAGAYTGETLLRDRRTQELTPEERGLADFERWKARRAAQEQ